MSDTNDDTSRALDALRRRRAEIDATINLLQARAEELINAIDLVERNGRRKPGPRATSVVMPLKEALQASIDQLPSFPPPDDAA